MTSTLRTRLLLTAATLVASATLATCGQGSNDLATSREPIDHVHGLGINPADGALFIATHGGLFRSPEDSTTAERVGESTQDTMGFTIVGPDRFLGSGHPGPGEDGQPNLGLIESGDAGASWTGVSLAGEADFHVLRYADERVYAVNGLTGMIMVSDDGGETWEERRPPAPVIDLAIDPEDPRRIVASTEAGLVATEDEGANWKPLGGEVGLVAWVESDALYLVNAAGQVQRSEDGGGRWTDLGSIGGQPAALIAAADAMLYAALTDGTVMSSSDGGTSWKLRPHNEPTGVALSLTQLSNDRSCGNSPPRRRRLGVIDSPSRSSSCSA